MQTVVRTLALMALLPLVGCVCSSNGALISGGCGTAGCTPYGCGFTPVGTPAIGGVAPVGGCGAAACNPAACQLAANQGFASGVSFGSAIGGGVKSVLAVPLAAATFVGGTVQSFFGCVFNCSATQGGINTVCNTDPCMCEGCGSDICAGVACNCDAGLSNSAIPVAPPVVPAPAYSEPVTNFAPQVPTQQFVTPVQGCQPCQNGGTVAPLGGQFIESPLQTQPVMPAPPASNIEVPATPVPVVPIPQDLTGAATTQQTSWRFAKPVDHTISAF